MAAGCHGAALARLPGAVLAAGDRAGRSPSLATARLALWEPRPSGCWRSGRSLGLKLRQSNKTKKVMRAAEASASVGGTRAVKYGPPAAATVVVPPIGVHTTTIIWLHGLGDTGTGWGTALKALALPHVKWVIPSAPIRPVTLNGGFPSPAWFDIRGLSADSPDDVRGLDAAASYISSLFEAEKALAPGVKYAVGGFSQGGALSLYLASRKAAGTFSNGTDASSIPISAAVCLSGWLPNAKALNVTKESAKRAGELPVLLCHGQGNLSSLIANP